jgi:hypothetical protein
VILPLLKVVKFEDCQFSPPQSATKQDCQRGPVPLIAEGVAIPFLEQFPRLAAKRTLIVEEQGSSALRRTGGEGQRYD